MMRGHEVAVVTGASSGIGQATALLLARHGYRVALLARRAARLRQLVKRIAEGGGQAIAIPADLSKELDRRRAHAIIKRKLTAVDVLINSAGLGWYGYAADMSWRTARQMLRVNIESTLQFTLACLGEMRKRKYGHIITVGSVAGGIPSQGVALYGATKAFLDSFTTALHRELHGTPVHVSIVRPGPVRTEFAIAARLLQNGRRVPTERMGVAPEDVADGIWGLIRHPRRVLFIPGWLRLVPWAELAFGSVIDRIGPLLLKTQQT